MPEELTSLYSSAEHSGTIFPTMGARRAGKLCLDDKAEDVRGVVRELRRWGELVRSGSSESESSSDDDDDTVVNSRCASAGPQTRCRQGGLDSSRP